MLPPVRVIAGDLDPSVFPWAGISIGEISLSNADGFGDLPFAKMGSADVKVELLPLLRRTVNIRTVELSGLELDLQRNAEGITNWDDLIATTSTRTTTEEEAGDAEVTTEVEGNTATIAALAVGGIDISNATVRWTDAQAGLDAQLSDFDLKTGTIELAKPFSLETNFSVASNSLDLAADIDGSGELPPKAEGEAEERAEEGGDAPAAEPSDPDAPIVLPTEMLQALDVDGTFTAGELIVSNLSTTDIVIPVKASGGKVGVDGVTASLYQGAISATANLDVSGGTPRYAAAADLADIQAEPLLGDEAEAKTDFSSLSVSGVFDNGVMTSNDLDMRAPLLRLDGAGTVALPAEKIDYVLGLLVTGTIEGQGGDDAEDLSGLDLDVGIDATFTELAEDPVKVLLSGLSSSYTSALQGNAKAAAEAKAEALKAEAQEALDAKEAELKEKLESELEGVIDEETQDKLKEGLKGLLNR